MALRTPTPVLGRVHRTARHSAATAEHAGIHACAIANGNWLNSTKHDRQFQVRDYRTTLPATLQVMRKPRKRAG